jgi:phosphatidylinositol 4-kinase
MLFQCSIDKKLGLFSDEEVEVSPLAAYEGCKLEPSPPFVKPHDIWVQVIFYIIAGYCLLLCLCVMHDWQSFL